MKRHEPCSHMRPDYDRMEESHHIKRDPVTDEISWPPDRLRLELARLGLLNDRDLDT